MKGKIAFVIGAAVGYVLGSRAGRERYEQIKRTAQKVWHTEPVQRGVGVVRDAIDDKADDVKAFVRRASSDVFANLAKQTANDRPPSRERSASGSPAKSAAKSAPKTSGKAATKSTSKTSSKANSKAADTSDSGVKEES